MLLTRSSRSIMDLEKKSYKAITISDLSYRALLNDISYFILEYLFCSIIQQHQRAALPQD